MEFFLIILLVVFIFLIYFQPSVVAINRGHPNKIPIFIINLFLGFTFFAWVISLAWACARISDEGADKINDKREKAGLA